MVAAKAFLCNEMEYYEIPALVTALCMMFMVVAAKIIITMRLSSLEKQLNVLEGLRQESLNRLKVIENEKAIANANLHVLTNKKLVFIKRQKHLRNKIEENDKEVLARRERTEISSTVGTAADARKVKM